MDLFCNINVVIAIVYLVIFSWRLSFKIEVVLVALLTWSAIILSLHLIYVDLEVWKHEVSITELGTVFIVVRSGNKVRF